MGNRSADQYKKRNRGRVRTGLSFLAVICLVILMAFPAYAARSGSGHHADTADYCMRVSDVTVGLSELSGLSEGEKQALVEKVSDYEIYTWSVPYRSWGERVSPRGNFGSVSWDRAGSYRISVSLPSLTDGVTSQISYTLTIIDDLPPEPSKYTIKVSFIDEESGLDVREPYILPDQVEGSSYDLTELTEKIPEGYVLSEVRGNLADSVRKDTDILILCRKIPALYSLTLSFVDQKTGLALADPLILQDLEEGSSYDLTKEVGVLPKGYEVSRILGELTGTVTEDLEITVVCKKTEEKPPNKDKDKNKGSGKKPSPSSGGSSQKPGNSSGRKTSGTSAAAAGGSAAVQQQNAAEEEAAREQAAERDDALRESDTETAAALEETEETTEAAETAETAETAREETEETDPGYESAVLAVTEEEEDQSEIGGALLPQKKKPERGLSLLGLTVGFIEGGILAVLSMLILSDLKLIRWFEEKKRR